jgi:nucleoside-diphosphate-sugar epimerase
MKMTESCVVFISLIIMMDNMKHNFIDNLEKQEIIQKLIDKGYGELIEALLMREGEVYTKKGRLNKSGACRILGWKPKELEDALKECKQILGPIYEE